MRTIVILAGLAVTGCASTAQIYSSEPTESATSAKPVAAVSSCLQTKYDTAPLATAEGETTIALKNMQRVTLATLTLRQAASGTLVELRRGNSIGALGDWRSCL